MKMFYLAYTNKGNVGDLLITKYQIEEYAKYGEVYVDCHGMPESFTRVIFDTNSPRIKDFESHFGYSYRSKKILKVLSIINNNNFTHFCGCPGPRETLALPLKKFLFKVVGAIIPAIFLSHRIKKYSLGVDVNFPSSGFWGWINTLYFARFDVLGIRSVANFERVRSSLHKAVYVPDMAFLYPKFEEESYTTTKRRIALSFRKVDDMGKLNLILESIVKMASGHSFNIDIVYQVDEDRQLCEQLEDKFSMPVVKFVDRSIDYYAIDRYKDYDLVISNRLHVLLMASLNGAIPLALISESSNEHKIQDIFGCVFGNDYLTEISQYNEDVFIRLINNLSFQKNDVSNKVKKQHILCTRIIGDLMVDVD